MESTAAHPVSGAARSIRVAIAEDDDAQREALQVALEEEGFEVDAFEDGFELLDYFDVAAAKRSWPDAIVTDMGMPGRSGLEAVAQARARGAMIPVFVVTGWTIAEVRAQAAQLGNTLVFAKPIDVEHLARAIGELVQVPAR